MKQIIFIRKSTRFTVLRPVKLPSSFHLFDLSFNTFYLLSDFSPFICCFIVVLVLIKSNNHLKDSDELFHERLSSRTPDILLIVSGPTPETN